MAVGERFARFQARHDGAMRQHASGLYVPEAVSRRRVVLTYQDWSKIERGMKTLARVDVLTAMKCKVCDGPIARVLLETGQTSLRCGCTDRVVEHAF